MNNYKEILTFSGKKLQTIKSKRSVVVVDTNARVGFDENEMEVVIYAQFYTNHDGRSILEYLKTKVEKIEDSPLNYSSMSKKELLVEADKKGLDVKSLSRKKNAEIVELLNED
ncbi:hypothetical protein [Lactococcus allomyrinae]|uniref:Uncharacterized protein n=1 Tax=Lactococcus allomyrinae TaxID=2419773 RepID=A0A387BHH1_9LACT|nr:hypothetical protein [Lactococcus allomyrinae]AYG01714.1 hypothetical protein D7I46_12005 [Lactococcus allomyrinae]